MNQANIISYSIDIIFIIILTNLNYQKSIKRIIIILTLHTNILRSKLIF